MAGGSVTQLPPAARETRPRPAHVPPALRPRPFVGPYALLWLYRRWLRQHLVQDVLAGLGVAIAVALVFATIVAAGSVSGATSEAVKTVIGPATLQLHARSADGIDGALLRRAQLLGGVRTAGALLEATATLRTRGGRTATVDLAGAGSSLVFMDGLAHTIPSATLSASGIGLSTRTAGELEIGGPPTAPRGNVEVYLAGRAASLPVSAVLGREAFGALSHTSVAVMQLSELQRLLGVGDRVSRILVQPRRGRTAEVRGELRRLAAGRIDVAAANQDDSLLAQALRPSNEASALFATISALLGVLLATAALLLTAPARRRTIAELRLMGMRRTAIVEMFAFQALVLGAAALILGLAVGYALSATLLAQSSRYLAEAFTLGTQTTLDWTAFAAAVATALLASSLASALPLLDLRSGDPLGSVYRQQGVPGNSLHPGSRRVLDAAALTLLAAACVLFATGASLALLACALLALATVCAVPLALSVAIRLCSLLADWRQELTALPVALSSLQASTLRSLALAATGAVALFGSIALGGARADLAHGIAGFAKSYAGDARIWVGNRADDQAVIGFAAGGLPRRISRLEGVAHVGTYRGGFLVLGGRRVWVIARPPGGARHVLSSQLISGSAAVAERRLAHGGWAVLSKQIAQQQHARIGGVVRIPTPSGPAALRVAALSSNLAWSPGAIFLGAAEYARLWRGAPATALGVSLRPGADAQLLATRIRRALGRSSGLVVRTRGALQASIDTLAGEGLGQLREISNLLLLAAILAMAAALTAAVWQRRDALAGLRLCGVPSARLRRILAVEATLMLSVGCLTGALAGVLGQAIIDGYLGEVTGFPIATIAADARPLEIFALVVLVVFAVACTPIVLASRISPNHALAE
ncbi:MAG: FtsX-like permease family protein [Solirubrobacteraceae bacterium]